MFPHLVSYRSAWGGKQHLISRTSRVSLHRPSCCLREPCPPLPHRFFCHFPSPQTRFSAGAAVCSRRAGQRSLSAGPINCCSCSTSRPTRSSRGFPCSWLGSLLIFIMQFYSSQNCFLYFIHPFAMSREILCLHYKKKIEAQ